MLDQRHGSCSPRGVRQQKYTCVCPGSICTLHAARYELRYLHGLTSVVIDAAATANESDASRRSAGAAGICHIDGPLCIRLVQAPAAGLQSYRSAGFPRARRGWLAEGESPRNSFRNIILCSIIFLTRRPG